MLLILAYIVFMVLEIAALSPPMMPFYQLAASAPPPSQMAAMLPAVGGMRADKLEVSYLLSS